MLTFFFTNKKDNIKLTTVAFQSKLVYVKNEITVTIFCSTVYKLQHNSCCSSIYISSCVIVVFTIVFIDLVVSSLPLSI